MTTEQQLQAIAEHLRKHGLLVDVYAYIVNASDKKDDPDLCITVVDNGDWQGKFCTPTVHGVSARQYDNPVDAFNAIADAAGVPQLEAAQ